MLTVLGAIEDDPWAAAPDPPVMASVAKNTASTYLGLTAAGIGLSAAALVAFPAAMILTWWGKKRARAERIAYYKEIGIYKRPTLRYRGVLRRLGEGTGRSRGSPSGIITDTVVEVIAQARPELSDDQLEEIWSAVFKTIRNLRASIPDAPPEFVADIVLALHGIHKEGASYTYRPEGPPENGAERKAKEMPALAYGILTFIGVYAFLKSRGG